jgi:hypothetical protein
VKIRKSLQIEETCIVIEFYHQLRRYRIDCTSVATTPLEAANSSRRSVPVGSHGQIREWSPEAHVKATEGRGNNRMGNNRMGKNRMGKNRMGKNRKGRYGKGRYGKGREGKGRYEKVREGEGRNDFNDARSLQLLPKKNHSPKSPCSFHGMMCVLIMWRS